MPSAAVRALALLPAVAATTLHTTSLPWRDATVGQQQRQLQSSYEWVGCFSDRWWDGLVESRPLDDGFESDVMTKELCHTECISRGYDVMALEHGVECLCGSSSDKEEINTYGEGACNMPCGGDSTQMCGGDWSFDLYLIRDISASTSAPYEGDGVDVLTSEKQYLLDVHNEARCVHGAEPLTWNDSVEETSRAHAETLTSPEYCGKYVFNSNLAEHGLGENIFLCTEGSGCIMEEGAFESLYDETVDTSGPVASYDVHARRMLWKATTELGCSISSCVFDNTLIEILVCNYDPIGEYSDPIAIEEEVEPPSKTREECMQIVAPSSSPTSSPTWTPTSSPTGVSSSPTTPSPTTPNTPSPVPLFDPLIPGVPEVPVTLEPTSAPLVPPTPAPVTPEPTPAPLVPPTPAPVTPEPIPAPVTPPTPTDAPIAEPNLPPAPAPVQPSPGVGACNPNPCLNGGSCDLDSSGLYTCTCAENFAGMNCETDTSALPTFFIEVDFLGTWTDPRRAVFRSAANRWAEVLTHIPCTGTNYNNGPAGELRISATLETIDGPSGTLGFAGPSGIWNDCRGISFSGDMTFDIDDIAEMERFGTFEGVILHEMGHVIGTGTLWGDCSDCDTTLSPEWKCPMAAQVYNGLAGNPPGSPANIIETSGGQGTQCGHFSEDTFTDEIMTGFVNAGSMPLSKLTAASLADRGYIVNMAKTDDYMLPSKRPLSAVGSEPAATWELNDDPTMLSEVIVWDPKAQTVVETVPVKRFRF